MRSKVRPWFLQAFLLGLFFSASASAGWCDGKPTIYNSRAEIPEGHSLCSPNGRFFFTLHPDGNLSIHERIIDDHTRQERHELRWQSGTSVSPRPGRLVMQEDGNLVLYNGAGRDVWSTDTAHSPIPDGAQFAVTLSNTGVLTVVRYGALGGVLYDNVNGTSTTLYIPGKNYQCGQDTMDGDRFENRAKCLAAQGACLSNHWTINLYFSVFGDNCDFQCDKCPAHSSVAGSTSPGGSLAHSAGQSVSSTVSLAVASVAGAVQGLKDAGYSCVTTGDTTSCVKAGVTVVIVAGSIVNPAIGVSLAIGSIAFNTAECVTAAMKGKSEVERKSVEEACAEAVASGAMGLLGAGGGSVGGGTRPPPIPAKPGMMSTAPGRADVIHLVPPVKPTPAPVTPTPPVVVVPPKPPAGPNVTAGVVTSGGAVTPGVFGPNPLPVPPIVGGAPPDASPAPGPAPAPTPPSVQPNPTSTPNGKVGWDIRQDDETGTWYATENGQDFWYWDAKDKAWYRVNGMRGYLAALFQRTGLQRLIPVVNGGLVVLVPAGPPIIPAANPPAIPGLDTFTLVKLIDGKLVEFFGQYIERMIKLAKQKIPFVVEFQDKKGKVQRRFLITGYLGNGSTTAVFSAVDLATGQAAALRLPLVTGNNPFDALSFGATFLEAMNMAAQFHLPVVPIIASTPTDGLVINSVGVPQVPWLFVPIIPGPIVPLSQYLNDGAAALPGFTEAQILAALQEFGHATSGVNFGGTFDAHKENIVIIVVNGKLQVILLDLSTSPDSVITRWNPEDHDFTTGILTEAFPENYSSNANYVAAANAYFAGIVAGRLEIAAASSVTLTPPSTPLVELVPVGSGYSAPNKEIEIPGREDFGISIGSGGNSGTPPPPGTGTGTQPPLTRPPGTQPQGPLPPGTQPQGTQPQFGPPVPPPLPKNMNGAPPPGP